MRIPKGTGFLLLILALLFGAQGSLIYYEHMPKTQPEDTFRFERLVADAPQYVLLQLKDPASPWHENPGQTFTKLLYLDGSKEFWIEWQASYDPSWQNYAVNITVTLTDGLMAGINGLVTRVISYEDQFNNLSIRENQILLSKKLAFRTQIPSDGNWQPKY